MKYLHSADSIHSDGRPETVMSLVDLSPSMDYDDWKPTRLAGAIKANTKLMEIKAAQHPQDKVGLIGFWEAATVLHSPVRPASGLKSLEKALKKASGGYGTNFTAALKLAEQTFAGRCETPSGGMVSRMLAEIFCQPDASERIQSDTGSLKRIILLTDGDHNQGGSPISIANRLKNAGVIIDCIGIGGSRRDVNENLLKRIASQNPDGSPRYWFIGDQEKLVKTYESLARHIQAI